MSESLNQNPLDQTDEYLEFLAGRRDKEPQLDPTDEDITKATRLLGTLRAHDPRPIFVPKIKHAVLATSQHVPRPPAPKPHRFTALLLWQISTPIIAAVVILGTLAVTRIAPETNHAGTNFKKTQITADVPAVVDLAATKEDALGVDAATSFIITAKTGIVTLADVQQNFTLNPRAEFTVMARGEAAYEIIPKTPLSTGTVYAATYQAAPTEVDGRLQPRSYSWAYQVRNEFGIIGLLPRDQATGVSVNSGIEVTFSSTGVTADDFNKNLTIVPATDGRIEVHQRTLVFVPTRPLTEKTIYTVTIKKGLKATNAAAGLAADEVWQFETAAKDSKDVDNVYASFFLNKPFESVRPSEPLVFANSQYDPSIKPKATRFIVYQYADLPSFTKAVNTQESSQISWAVFGAHGAAFGTDGLKKVGVYKTTTTDGVTMLGPGWPAGFYLADGGTGANRAQIPFAVSDVGTYSMTTKTDSIIWAHNLKTKQPIVGAAVTIPGTPVSALTGTDGVARFATPIDALDGGTKAVVAILNDGASETPVVLNGTPYYGRGFGGQNNSDYWSYLSTDRSLYQPTDTVHFWGLLRRRDQPRPSEIITAQLIQRSFEGRYEPQTLASSTLTASSTGTYIGSLSLQGVATNVSTELVISVDGQTVMSRYLTIETYRKPPFQILLEPDRLAAIAGETVTYKITSQFFDGTPVPDLALTTAYGGESKTVVTTNTQGQATYKKTVTERDASLALTPTDDQVQGVVASSYIQVYPSALEITAATTLQDTIGTLTGTVNQVHPEKAKATVADPLADVRGPVQPNQIVDGRLIEIIYEKTEIGKHYDYLLKQSVPDYQYSNKDEVRETFAVTTDANGAFTKTFTLQPTSVYRVELTTTDAKSRAATATGYFWHSIYNNLYSGTQYSLTDAAQRDGAPMQTYPVGAQVTLQVLSNGAAATVPTDGAVLYLFNQRGLRRYEVTTSPTETFTFGEGDVPSISTRAVIFTGVGYAEMYGPTTLFNKDSRNLTIAVAADKTTYSPGDRVRLTVRTTDQNGRGQAARVNLKAVDEALLSLAAGDDSYYTPSSIYQQVEDGVFGTYVSHEAVASRAMAEGGGGGGDRTDFKDTAVFTEITTDTQGNGSLIFTLPDNLTSWRVTAQGFTDGLLAGKSQTALTVSKDVFATVAVEPDQLSRDQTTLLAATYGRALTANDGVGYTLSLPDVPNSETALSAKAFTTVRFTLPELAPGTYKVRLETKAKDKTDAVVSTVVVSASRLQRRTVKSVMLPASVPLAYGLDGRTVFRFDDADRNLGYATLWGLVGAAYNRLDDVVADQIARRLLSAKFQETIGGAVADPAIFMTGKGAALYVVGSANLEVGALAAGDPSLAAERQQLLGWFQGVLDDPKQNTEQVAQALYGLAQLGQPVLPDIRAVLALPDLADSDRLTLLLALEALGAKEEARPGALALLQKYGESQDSYFRLNLGEGDDAKIVASARLAILAAGLGLDQRYGLLNYLQNYPPRDTRTTLEQALATARLLDSAPTNEATVTYEVDGKASTATLSATKPLIVTASVDQAKSLKITGSTGNVSVVSAYQEPFDITKANRDPRLALTRTYLVNNKKTTTFTTGDLVKVQFTWTKKTDAIGKSFGVTDLLPTGLRPVSNPWMYDRNSKLNAPYAIAGQRTQLYAGANGATFYYLARASAPGQAVAEPAILQAFDAPSSIQYSSEAVVEIK